MKNRVVLVVLLGLILTSAQVAWGDQIKAYVAAFAVTGVQNRDELKPVLQALLMSRLNGERIVVVDSPAGADVTVTGSYVAFGKIFSLDAAAKTGSGKVIARVFVQGDNQDELIPAVGKLAQTLTEGIVKGYQPSVAVPSLPPADAPRLQVPAPEGKESSAAAGTDLIRAPQVEKSTGSSWASQRIAGAMIGMAVGRTLANGDRELFVAGDRLLRLYRQGKEMQLTAEATLPGNERILGIDTADLDDDGVPEVYVTVLTGDALASQVWVVKDATLSKSADNLPYFFRGIALGGGKKKIYVQQMSSDSDFYGDVFELVKNGAAYEAKTPIKLPRFGNLFNFNTFTDLKGATYFVVTNNEGYLIVYSKDREELWRSSDKFGGSEVNFQRTDYTNIVTTGESRRWVYLDQRIVVTKDGEVIAPHNAGFWVLGNSRSYSKSSVYCFAWNGSALEERWHTKQSQNYLADYSYNESRKELILLEVAKKAGLIEKGASVILIKKVE